jgi:hypothetical protein
MRRKRPVIGGPRRGAWLTRGGQRQYSIEPNSNRTAAINANSDIPGSGNGCRRVSAADNTSEDCELAGWPANASLLGAAQHGVKHELKRGSATPAPATRSMSGRCREAQVPGCRFGRRAAPLHPGYDPTISAIKRGRANAARCTCGVQYFVRTLPAVR